MSFPHHPVEGKTAPKGTVDPYSIGTHGPCGVWALRPQGHRTSQGLPVWVSHVTNCGPAAQHTPQHASGCLDQSNQGTLAKEQRARARKVGPAGSTSHTCAPSPAAP